MTLNEYLKKHKMSARAFASKSGVTEATVSRIRSSVVFPCVLTAQQVMDATKNAVTLNDFMRQRAAKTDSAA